MSYTIKEINEIIEQATSDEDLDRIESLQDDLFEEAPAGLRPFSAAVRVKGGMIDDLDRDAEESALALNLANTVARAGRWIKYQAKRRKDPSAPIIVSEGDSWFQYPVKLNDVIDNLIDTDKYAMYSLGAAGDTVDGMIRSGEYLDTIKDKKPLCFIFSGGGNDLVGDGKLAEVLKTFAGETEPSDLINDDAFSQILDEVIGGFETVLRKVSIVNPSLPVLSHGYDHPAKIKKGPWIWPPMLEKGIPESMGRMIVAILLSRFNAELQKLTLEFPNFIHIETTGIVGNSINSWYDALHPRDQGYKRVAELFEKEIDDLVESTGHSDEVATEATFIARPHDRGIGRAVAAQAISQTGPVENFTASEAIIRHFRLPGCYGVDAIDFGPESRWRLFTDPKVYEQIKDVLNLLKPKEGTSPQAEQWIKNRIRTRPHFAGSHQHEIMSREDLKEITESIISGNDLEPIQSLIEGYRTGRAVGLVQVVSNFGIHIGSGSGFLVAPGVFLTNNHVLSDADTAARSYIVFNNEVTLQGKTVTPERFRITSNIFFTSNEMDFTFVSVEPENSTGTKITDFPSLPMIRLSGKAIVRESVSIIQHPDGRPKMIAHRNSYVIGRVNEAIYYTTDTMGGSSGSPVVNREWQVVGLHHRTVPHPTKRGEYIANRGIRISAIFDFCMREGQRGNRMAEKVVSVISTLLGHPESTVHAQDSNAIYTDHEMEDKSIESDNDDLISDGVYEGLTNSEFLYAIGQWDVEEIGLSDHEHSNEIYDDEDTAEALSTDPDSVRRRIGKRGIQFIIGHEVSSKRNYNRKLKNPILPGGASGITIGIGYDLGYQSLSGFRKDWKGLLSSNDRGKLERCLGKTRGAARRLLRSVQNVEIPYDDAIEVFERTSLPKYFSKLDRHMDDARLEELAPDCIAALVSLTFNRGASYGLRKPRYREMRAIKRDINSGRFSRIPGHLRDMKRLWVGDPRVRGLLRRRDEEAALFERGLRAMRRGGDESSDVDHFDLQDFNNDTADPIFADQHPSSDIDGFDELTHFYSSSDGDEQSELDAIDDGDAEVLEARRRRLGMSTVRWVSSYENNPDYWHLPASAEGKTFSIDQAVVEKAISFGHYQPNYSDSENLIIGIRGAKLASRRENELDQSSLEIIEQKPDHRHFRCVIAVYNKDTGRLSGFKASTVPNRGGVAAQYNRANGHGGMNANMLPTGCYDLCVGTHYGSHIVPNVLRLGTGPTTGDALRVTTLRTINDTTYGTADFWDNCIPKDNVHPAFSARTADFSSLGCLTVPGRYSGGRHRGQWAIFQKQAGFNRRSARGNQYSIFLTTGMELSAIEQALDGGGSVSLSKLDRLSHGSQGTAVETLQERLGLRTDGDFGPGTKKALIKQEQKRNQGKASGIYSSRTRI